MDLASLTQKIASTIGIQETSGGTSGVGLSLNNPGAIKYSSWESVYGATPSSSGFASFPSQAQGQNALQALIQKYIAGGASLQSLIGNYAPPKDANVNNPQRVAQLAQVTSLDPAQPINQQISAASANPILTGIAKVAYSTVNVAQQATTGTAAGAPVAAGQTVWGTVTWSRFGAFLAGVICLIAGLFLMKQTQVVIETAGKTAAKAAAA